MNRRMMKRMQQKMQDNLTSMQQNLADQEVTGVAQGGLVTVKMNGQMEILSIKIDRSVVDPEDVETLEDLVLIATKEALTKSQELGASMVSQMTGGMNLPFSL